MEDTTITSASYQPIENYRPFAKDTVHTLSYMSPPETEKVTGYKKENDERTTIKSESICLAISKNLVHSRNRLGAKTVRVG
jgi:hypothetical protein